MKRATTAGPVPQQYWTEPRRRRVAFAGQPKPLVRGNSAVRAIGQSTMPHPHAARLEIAMVLNHGRELSAVADLRNRRCSADLRICRLAAGPGTIATMLEWRHASSIPPGIPHLSSAICYPSPIRPCYHLPLCHGQHPPDKVWDAHAVRTLPNGQTQLFVGLHLIHEVTTPQAFDMLRARGLGCGVSGSDDRHGRSHRADERSAAAVRRRHGGGDAVVARAQLPRLRHPAARSRRAASRASSTSSGRSWDSRSRG